MRADSGQGLTRRAAVAAPLAAAALAAGGRHAEGQSADPWLLADQIRARIVVPTFPAREVTITAFGAVGDGHSLCTRAIMQAVNACADAGGGRVIVPAGSTARTFLTGGIRLRSNVNLVVEAGATLLFSTDPRHYLPVVRTSYEGSDCYNYAPFIYAPARTNVAVTGGGVLDGQASNAFWWPWTGNPSRGWKPGMPAQEPDRGDLHAQNEAGVPTGQRIYGEGHYLRPSFLQFRRCDNVLVEGVTIRNGPFWLVHPLLCRHVTIRGVTAVSRGPNNDGVDIENCQHVLVTGCTFDTGDDCIAIKAGRARDGLWRDMASRYIVVADNRVAGGIGAVVFGSEQGRGIKDVFVEDLTCTDPDLAFGLLFKANRRWGPGIVERVRARRIALAGVRNAGVAVNLRINGIDDGIYLPVVRNLDIGELTCMRANNALTVTGLSDSPVANVALRDSTFTNVAGAGVIQSNATGLRLNNVSIDGNLVSI
jgi:polygalacturonase